MVFPATVTPADSGQTKVISPGRGDGDMPIGGQPGAPDESTPGTTTQPLTALFDRSTRTGDVRKSASPSGRFRADSTARLSGHDEDVADLVVETEGPTKRYGDRLAVDTSSLWSAAASRMTGLQPSRPPQQRTPPVASDTGGRPGPAIARLRPRSLFAAVPGACRHDSSGMAATAPPRTVGHPQRRSPAGP